MNDIGENTDDNVTIKSTKETRKIVTPYAFGVSDELLGTPLASPLHRAASILLDLLFIGLLTLINNLVLALLSAWAFWHASGHIARSGRYKRILIALLRTIAAILVFGVAFAVLESDDFQNTRSSSGTDETIIEENDGAQLPDAATEPETPAPIIPSNLAPVLNSNAPSPSIISWLKGIANDLGFGLGWATFYFTVFCAWWNGQTPAKKILGIRIVKLDGQYMNLWESFGRYGGYGAGLATGLLGFLQIFWDPNRQAIQDKISETLVINIRKSKPK